MTRAGINIYLFIFAVSIIFSGCGRDGLFSDCDRVIKATALSSDGKQKIAILSVQCGATTADATWLLLASSDQSFDYERDVFAVFQGDDVRAVWDGDSVVVTYGDVKKYQSESSFRGTHISYKKA
jgi:hypothetical protein